MSTRLEMLQVARLSPRLLSDATQLVADFVLGKLNEDGGFADRGGRSDIYYSVFGLGCLAALQVPLPEKKMSAYLSQFEQGETLDLVHLASLVRCWAGLGSVPDRLREVALERLEGHRSQNGGYHLLKNQAAGTAYAGFLAAGVYEDCETAIPNHEGLIQSLTALEALDGGYGDQPGLPMGTTPSTAAVVTLMRQAQTAVPDKAVDWLRQRFYVQGGFFALPAAPMPDLLSTAVCLHALAGQSVDLEPMREACLDYIDSLWVNNGAFFGSWGDDILDCEYTFYGLLALGHLSL